MGKQSDIEKSLRAVLAENPDLPILVLSNDVGGDFESYYHFVTHASVEDIIFPLEIEKEYGHTFGLNPERWYDDPSDAEDDVEGWLWDNGFGSEYCRKNGHGNQYFDWVKVYGPIAKMIAEDMPSQKFVVIRAEM